MILIFPKIYEYTFPCNADILFNILMRFLAWFLYLAWVWLSSAIE